MIDRTRFVEHIKTCVIVILLAVAVALIYFTGYYSSTFETVRDLLSDEIEISSGDTGSGAEKMGLGSVRAMELGVSFPGGGLYGCAYDESVDTAYGRFSAFLAEALGSAAHTRDIDRDTWLSYLEGESVYIRYFCPQSLEVLSVQLGSVLSGNASEAMASEFCLSCVDGTVILSYRSGEAFYSCTTAVSASALRERMNEYSTNEVFFSHRDSILGGLKDSLLIIRNLTSVPGIEASAVAGNPQIAEELMSFLGMNEHTASKYTESDGTQVFVTAESILRLSSSGFLVYENDSSSAFAEIELYDKLELCWEIIGGSIALHCGEADIYMSSLESDANGGYVISFDYMMNGIPVRCGGRHAAVFSFSDRALESAELYYRSYAAGDDTFYILPMYQAAAIASSENSSIYLTYSDSTEKTECIWVNK